MELLLKLIRKEAVTDSDIEDELREICEREHSSCNSNCPVYVANGYEAPIEKGHWGGCDCFKSGEDMLAFLRENLGN